MKPLRSASGKAVIRAFEELILFGWETPEYVITDNGKEFDNKTFENALTEYGMKIQNTLPSTS